MEYPFCVAKRQFDHAKVRHRNLAKYMTQMHTLFVLPNLRTRCRPLLARINAQICRHPFATRLLEGLAQNPKAFQDLIGKPICSPAERAINQSHGELSQSECNEHP